MMQDDLRATLYCDYGHPDIQAAAAKLKEVGGDHVAVAGRTFLFARDTIRFGVDLCQTKASETLKRGYGTCWNKNLLLTALLRCNGIPARFGWVPLKRTFAIPLVGDMHQLLNDPFNHCVAQAFLNDRWIMLDPTLDRKTYEACYSSAGVEWGIDWNGQDDVRLFTESIAGPVVFCTDIDAALDNRVGNKEIDVPTGPLLP